MLPIPHAASPTAPVAPVPVGPDGQLCADLVAASRAVVAAYDGPLHQLGLTYVQYLVLLELWESDAPVPVGDLAAAVGIQDEDAHPVVRSMVVSGTAVRTADPERVGGWLVAAGPRAEALRSPVAQVQCDLRDRLGIGTAEIRALQGSLRTIARSMRAA